jgi:hypothetical protein
MFNHVSSFAPIALLAMTIAACSVPLPIKRSAFVPRAQGPSQAGAPLGEEHGLRIFGGITSFEITKTDDAVAQNSTTDVRNLNDVTNLLTRDEKRGAAGLLIPTLQFGGGIYGGPSEVFEVGGQVKFTHLDWAKPNLDGVLPFPEQHEDQWMILGGPGVRLNMPLEETIFTPAILFEVNLTSIPQAVYECVANCTRIIDPTMPTLELTPEYEFKRLDKEQRFILPSFSLHLSVDAHEWIDVVGFLGGQRSVKNIGFDENKDNLKADTFEAYWLGTGGAGVEFRYNHFSVTSLLFFSFLEPEEIASSLSGTLQLAFLL